MRGRKPKPTALKELTGNPGHRPPNRREPKPRGNLSAQPDWFSDSQRQGWAYAIAHAPPGLLRRLDRGALVVWVVAEDLHRQASLELQKSKLVITMPKTKARVQSPLLSVLNRQAQIMLKAASELGFSPVSRSRVVSAEQLPPAADMSEADAYTEAEAFQQFIEDGRRPN